MADADALRPLGVAELRTAAGLDVYLDIVLHQLMGENGGPGVFRYGWSERGTGQRGRGAMHSGCFPRRCAAGEPPGGTPVPGRPRMTSSSAVKLVYQNLRIPAGYTIEDAIDYGGLVVSHD